MKRIFFKNIRKGMLVKVMYESCATHILQNVPTVVVAKVLAKKVSRQSMFKKKFKKNSKVESCLLSLMVLWCTGGSESLERLEREEDTWWSVQGVEVIKTKIWVIEDEQELKRVLLLEAV